MFRTLWNFLGGSSRHPSACPRRSCWPSRRSRLVRKPGVETLEPRRVLSHSVTNSVSMFPIEVDGAFTPPGEWLDVTPLAFHSPVFLGDTFRATLRR
jgi:hypothetical protein